MFDATRLANAKLHAKNGDDGFEVDVLNDPQVRSQFNMLSFILYQLLHPRNLRCAELMFFRGYFFYFISVELKFTNIFFSSDKIKKLDARGKKNLQPWIRGTL